MIKKTKSQRVGTYRNEAMRNAGISAMNTILSSTRLPVMSEIDLYAEIEKSNNIRSGDQEYEQSWDGTKSTIGYPTTFFDDVVDVAGDIVEGAGDFAVGVGKGLPWWCIEGWYGDCRYFNWSVVFYSCSSLDE